MFLDPLIVASMVFSLIVLLMVGGFILLLPLSRRLGELLDLWISEQKSLKSGREDPGDAVRLLSELSERVRTLEEQQGFLEDLVGESRRLPRSGSDPR